MAAGVTDPITYLISYFIFSAIPDGLIGIANISIITSVIAYPFVMLGKMLTKNKPKFAKKALVIIILLLLFWLISRAISFIAAGSAIIEGSIAATLFLGTLASVGSIIMFYAGMWFYGKARERWTMPKPLVIYLVTLFCCVLFWSAARVILAVMFNG